MRAGRKKSMKFAKAVVIKKEGESMKRKIGSAILKGSMLLAAIFLMEGSLYPVQAEEYSTFGTFSPDHFPAAAKEGETIEEESGALSLGEKISRFPGRMKRKRRPQSFRIRQTVQLLYPRHIK